MDAMTLVDPRDDAWAIEVPRTAFERMRGLLGRDGLGPLTGMLFLKCRAIHTVRMRFELDVVFLDEGFRAVEVRTVAPGRWSVRRGGATHVLEVAGGSSLRPGDVLRRG